MTSSWLEEAGASTRKWHCYSITKLAADVASIVCQPAGIVSMLLQAAVLLLLSCYASSSMHPPAPPLAINAATFW